MVSQVVNQPPHLRSGGVGASGGAVGPAQQRAGGGRGAEQRGQGGGERGQQRGGRGLKAEQLRAGVEAEVVAGQAAVGTDAGDDLRPGAKAGSWVLLECVPVLASRAVLLSKPIKGLSKVCYGSVSSARLT